ncbi:hypothetical protein [Azospirillum largimobile]
MLEVPLGNSLAHRPRRGGSAQGIATRDGARAAGRRVLRRWRRAPGDRTRGRGGRSEEELGSRVEPAHRSGAPARQGQAASWLGGSSAEGAFHPLADATCRQAPRPRNCRRQRAAASGCSRRFVPARLAHRVLAPRHRKTGQGPRPHRMLRYRSGASPGCSRLPSRRPLRNSGRSGARTRPRVVSCPLRPSRSQRLAGQSQHRAQPAALARGRTGRLSARRSVGSMTSAGRTLQAGDQGREPSRAASRPEVPALQRAVAPPVVAARCGC